MQCALNKFAVNGTEITFILFTSGLPDAYKKSAEVLLSGETTGNVSTSD